MFNSDISIKQIKLEAKFLKKERSIQYSKALEIISQSHGFQNWHHANKLAHDTQEQIKTKHQFPFRFIMDRKDAGWDFSDNSNSDYIEDDDLFEAVLEIGLKKGFNERKAYEFLEDLAFLRHKTAIPKTPFEAVEIITGDFFFPPICIWLDGIEHIHANDPNNPSSSIWRGYSHKELFDEEELE